MNKEERKNLLIQSMSIFFALALSILFFFILYRMNEISVVFGKVWSAISPFVFGAAFAYVLNPVCNYFERLFETLFDKMNFRDPLKKARPVSVIVTVVLSLMLIYFLIATLLPQVVDSIVGLVNTMPDKITKVEVWAQEKLEGEDEILNYMNSSMDAIEDYIYKWFQTSFLPNINTIVGSFSSGVASVFNFLKNAFISIIVTIYVLLDRKKVVRKLKILFSSILKERQFQALWTEMKFADKMFSGFISGKIIDSAIIGLITFIVLSIWNMVSGFNYVLIISVVIGVTNIIPFFGPFIGAVPCAILTLLDSPMNCLGFIIFVVILQQIDGNILGPKILGNATGISSFGVLFAVILFGSIWGFMGMLIGVPVYGIIYDVVMKLIMKGLRRNGNYELADECYREREESMRTNTTKSSKVSGRRSLRRKKQDEDEK